MWCWIRFSAVSFLYTILAAKDKVVTSATFLNRRIYKSDDINSTNVELLIRIFSLLMVSTPEFIYPYSDVLLEYVGIELIGRNILCGV